MYSVCFRLTADNYILKVIKKMISETSSGALLANDCLVHYTISDLPFGGVGKDSRTMHHLTFRVFFFKKNIKILMENPKPNR